MANLQETAQWETGIYQLETSDPVMGGADGIDNRQAKQLGNRTLWLKNELELMSRTIPAAVTKSDAVNSNSSTDVATSKAVKTAYDKAVAAENAASGAVKTSGNQDIGGNKIFTAAATFKGGAFVADSVADFAANQYLQIGANNVNTYLHNKRSGKYLSMRNDGELRYDGKRLLNTDDLSGMVPSGTVLYFAGSSAPAGWLKANGAAVSRTAYAALFAAIGTTYGLGDGRSTFNLPDLRGEFIRGWDDGRGVDTPRPMARRRWMLCGSTTTASAISAPTTTTARLSCVIGQPPSSKTCNLSTATATAPSEPCRPAAILARPMRLTSPPARPARATSPCWPSSKSECRQPAP